MRGRLNPIHVVIAICAIYTVLGTAMEEISMILLTVPLFFPIIFHLGFDPVWFGILIVVVVTIALLAILIAFPGLSLWLPSLMK